MATNDFDYHCRLCGEHISFEKRDYYIFGNKHVCKKCVRARK